MKAIYIRTSTEEQKPENQIRDIEKIAGTEYLLFMDKQSAWKEDKERPEFERLKKEIKNKKIKKLYCWDLDRIYRNRQRLLGFFEFCKMHNCLIYSFRQSFLSEMQDLTLPKGFEFIKEMMINQFLNFLGWIAEEESTKKSERVKLAVRKKGNTTISYKGNKWGRKSISTQTKNKIIELHKQRKSIRGICKEIFTYTKRGKKNISVGVVHKIIAEYKEKNKINNP